MFPSNQQLALRAHGMAPATLRRHLAALVDCGLIIRRDSPNGKRYARKGQGGAIEMAFGFDLSAAGGARRGIRGLGRGGSRRGTRAALVRERITLCRRDIAKMIATGIEEGVPTRRAGQGPADWAEIHGLYRSILDRIPRTATREELEPIAEDLTLLADEILNLLESHIKIKNTSANESQTERHIQNSNPNPQLILNLASKKPRGEVRAPVGTLETSTTRLSSWDGPRGLPGHRRLRQGRDFELARFRLRRGGRALDARNQPQRLGGGAIGHGRNCRRDRRRRDPAKRRGDHERRRLLARTHPKSRGRANSRSDRC